MAEKLVVRDGEVRVKDATPKMQGEKNEEDRTQKRVVKEIGSKP